MEGLVVVAFRVDVEVIEISSVFLRVFLRDVGEQEGEHVVIGITDDERQFPWVLDSLVDTFG